MIIISFQKRKNRITIMQAIINKSKQSNNKNNKYKSSTFIFIFFYFSFFSCLSKLIKGNLINLLRFFVVELPF